MSIEISVCVPVYNVASYLQKCLESLASQTLASKAEFIFVNDCTTDNSMEILYDWKKNNGNLNILIINHEVNRGLAAARNTALHSAHGKYFVFMDSDDWVEPTYLEKLYCTAQEKDADIVACNCFIESISGSSEKQCLLVENSEANIKNLLEGKTTGWLWTKLFKRDLFFKNNIEWVEGINFFEDVLIDIKLYDKAKRISHIDIPLYHYNNLNQNSLTHNLNDSNCNQLIHAIQNIENYLYENNKLEIYDTELTIKKAYIKSWILKSSEHLKKEYVDLYKDIDFSAYKQISKNKRLLLFLARLNLYAILHFLRYSLRFYESIRFSLGLTRNIFRSR